MRSEWRFARSVAINSLHPPSTCVACSIRRLERTSNSDGQADSDIRDAAQSLTVESSNSAREARARPFL